jgi:hypothetical protein
MEMEEFIMNARSSMPLPAAALESRVRAEVLESQYDLLIWPTPLAPKTVVGIWPNFRFCHGSD